MFFRILNYTKKNAQLYFFLMDETFANLRFFPLPFALLHVSVTHDVVAVRLLDYMTGLLLGTSCWDDVVPFQSQVRVCPRTPPPLKFGQTVHLPLPSLRHWRLSVQAKVYPVAANPEDEGFVDLAED